MIPVDRNFKRRIAAENAKGEGNRPPAPTPDLLTALEQMIRRGLYTGTLQPDRRIGY